MSTNVLVVDTNTSSTSYSVALNSGRPYRWNVNACNSAGCSGFTAGRYFQTPTVATLPGAPQNLAASGGNGVVGLAWNAPSSNGGAAITSYRVFRGTTSSNRQIVTSGGCANLGAVLGCADTSVTNGQSYNYIVSAVNNVGQGPPSNSAIATPASSANLPSAPQNLAASGGNGLNGLAWNAPSSNGGAAITSYRVFRGTTSSNRQIVTSGGCANLGAVLGCADTGVTNGQSYNYIVSAVNSVGQGPPSNSATATPTSSTSPAISSVSPNPFPASTSNQILTINGSGFTSSSTVTLRSPFQTYPNHLTMSKTATQIVMQVNLGTTAAQWTVEVLNGSQSSGQFPFQVSATTGTFTLTNNAPVCDTNPPVAPAVRLNWNQSNGATSYDLYRNGTLYTSGLTGLTFYNNLNVNAGQTYSYFVRARHSSGSVDSNGVTVVVPTNICNSASPPTISSINPSNVTVNQVTVLTVNGSNFKSGFGASVTTSLGTFNIAAAGLTFVNSNQVRVQVTMGGAPPLTATLRITNIDGQSVTGTFQVVSQQQAPGAFSLSNQIPVCDTNAPVAPAVRLNWTPSNNATSYDLHRNGTSYVTGISGTTFYNSANVVAGQTYSYFIRARNSAGSADSNTVNVTVPSNICSNASSPPLISRITPSAVTVNQTTTLTVIGTNFQSNFGVTVQGSAIDPTGLKFISSGEVTVSVRMGGIPPYSASLVLTNLTDGKTATGTFTVSAPSSQSQAPTASFTHTPTSPATGQSVQFTDRSTGGGLTWSWDFDGDGVTDSQAQNASYAFTSVGPAEVTLRVTNSYGTDSITKAINVGTNAGTPTITDVIRKYNGYFLKGSGLDITFDTRVDWKGSPGTVGFSVNGAAPLVATGSSSGGQYTFNLDRDFPVSFTPSAVRITPTNSAGIAGPASLQYIHVFPLPKWLTDELSFGRARLNFVTSNKEVTAIIEDEFPNPRLSALIELPEWVPYLGGQFGLTETYAKFNGRISSLGHGSLSVFGQTGFRFKDDFIAGSGSGSGQFSFLPPQGLRLTSASLNLTLSGNYVDEIGIVDAIPQLKSLSLLRSIGLSLDWLNEFANLQGHISPSLNLSASFAQNANGNLEFAQGAGTFGMKFKPVANVHIPPFTVRGWVAGEANLSLGLPPPFLRRFEVKGQAGVSVTLSYLVRVFGRSLGSQKTVSAQYDFMCGWPSAAGGLKPDCRNSGSTSSSATFLEKSPNLSLIQPQYGKFGAFSVFQQTGIAKTASALVPASTQESTFLTNTFPGGSPVLVEVGAGNLLLWVQQNPSLPVLQSTDISWSYFNGASWLTPARIASDAQVELAPTAGVDANGKVVAAWLRIKDPAFSVPLDNDSDIPLFYNRFDVVSAIFDPTSRTWGSITQLTNDDANDNDLKLSRDHSGRLLLTWLSNPAAEFTSTPTAPSVLKFSIWDGSRWSSPAPIATNLVGVNRHTAAIRGNDAFVVLARDPSPDASNDGFLEVYAWNGTNWSPATIFAAGGVENRLPAAIYDTTGQGHVVWLRGNDLVHATLSAPTPRTVRTSSRSLDFYDTRLLNNQSGNLTMVWQQPVDNGPANLFAMLFDPVTQTWSADRRLHESPDLAHSVSGYYGGNGQLHLAYLGTGIIRTDETVNVDGVAVSIPGVPQDGQTDLRLLSHSLVNDLAVSDLDLTLNPRPPSAGDTVVVNVDVHNAGDFAVGNFAVGLYVGEPAGGGNLVVSTSISDVIKAGDHRLLTFNFTMPEATGNIIAIVDPNNAVTEFSETNNRATYYVNNTAPQPRVTANVTSGPAALLVNFDASGSFDMEADPITFTWAFADGSQSVTGGTVSHTFNQPGTYAVTVTATDSKGAASAAVVTITVTAPAMQVFLDPSAADVNRAAAVDSLLLVKEPFRVLNPSNALNSASDKNTRVVFFVSNLQLPPGQTASSVVVTLTHQNNQTYDIAAQDLRTVPSQTFTQVTFRLPDNLPDGTCVLKVKANGQSSNIGTIRIKN
jgi:PKD repeat protein